VYEWMAGRGIHAGHERGIGQKHGCSLHGTVVPGFFSLSFGAGVVDRRVGTVGLMFELLWISF